MKICVFTCITGNYDKVKEIEKDNLKEGIDFICYTNNKKVKSKTWKVIYIEDESLSNVQLARKIKILGTEELKKYDVTLWMDGDIQWKTPIKSFIKKYVDLDKYDVVGFKHFERKSINEEVLACFELEKIGAEEAKKVQDYYKKENFKDDKGLIETTVLFRNFNNKRVQEAMKKWFDMIINLTHRDQLSFNYVESITNLKVNLLDIKIWFNDYFTFYKHSKMINAYVYPKVGKSYYIDATKISDISDKNELDIVVPCNTDSIRIKFDNKYGLYVKNIKCDKNIEIIDNCYLYEDKKMCCFCPLILELNGSFKKNEKIHLSFELEMNDVIEIMNKLHDQIELNKSIIKEKERLEEELKQHLETINQMVNSKSWKITKPIRAITNKVKKRK